VSGPNLGRCVQSDQVLKIVTAHCSGLSFKATENFNAGVKEDRVMTLKSSVCVLGLMSVVKMIVFFASSMTRRGPLCQQNKWLLFLKGHVVPRASQTRIPFNPIVSV